MPPFAPSAWAARHCFLAVDLADGTTLAESAAPADACALRAPPNSTFKVALALMAADAGLLASETEPVFTPPPGPVPDRVEARGPQTPRSWIQHSVVWVSQVLARRLGARRVAGYLRGFDYGNGDMAGLKGEAEPLARFWLSSSLAISPREQIGFLSRMLKGSLPVSAAAKALAERLMATASPLEGWQVFGKTGTGSGRRPDGSLDPQRPFGWFVGFLRNEGRTVVFARFLALDTAATEPLGPRARREALDLLGPLLSPPPR